VLPTTIGELLNVPKKIADGPMNMALSKKKLVSMYDGMGNYTNGH
jgi:hypothetical protein